MRTCPECNHKVPDNLTTCPECGFPFDEIINEKKPKTIPVKVRAKKKEEVPKKETGFVLIEEEESQFNHEQAAPTSEVELIPQRKCPRCGSSVNGDSAFCPTCGQAMNIKITCEKCGQELTENMQFCPNCGTPTSSVNTEKATDATRKTIASTNTKKYALIALAVLAAIALIYFLMNGQSSKLEDAYEAAGGYANGTFMTLNDDGKSLTIDTNPSDTESFYSSDANKAIRDVNKSLGLPDALWEKMLGTRAIDGTQTSTYDDITVTWHYHPDQGLEIIYELTK